MIDGAGFVSSGTAFDTGPLRTSTFMSPTRYDIAIELLLDEGFDIRRFISLDKRPDPRGILVLSRDSSRQK